MSSAFPALHKRTVYLLQLYVSEKNNDRNSVKSVIQVKLLASTDQLCNLFLNDLFDLDVVYLVMTAELL